MLLLLFCITTVHAQTRLTRQGGDTTFYHLPEKHAVIYTTGKKAGLIDSSRHVMLPAVYDQIIGFPGGFHYCYRNGGKYGFLHEDGTVNLKAQYDAVLRPQYPFKVVPVCRGGKWGVIDTTGQIIADFQYDQCSFYTLNGIAIVTKDHHSGFIDTTGKQLGGWYDRTGLYFQFGYCPVKKNGKWSFIGQDGNEIGDFVYDEVAYFSKERIARVKVGRRYGYIDTTGKLLITPHYRSASHFSEGLCAVKKGNKWGYVDKNDSPKIPFMYKDAGVFSSGVAPVKLKRKYGYIGIEGKTVIAFQFHKARSFSDSATYASVKRYWYSRNWNLIDRKGVMQ